MLAVVSPDVLIEVEFTNEHWDNTFVRNNILWSYGNISGLFPTSSTVLDQIYTLRASQVHQAFFDVFDAAGRGNQIIRLFAGFWVEPIVTTNMCAYAAANNIQMDAIVIAPYPGIPRDIPLISAGALLATYSADSVLFGATSPWTRPMMSSVLRHHTKYGSDSNLWAQHASAITQNYIGAGAPATRFGRFPVIGCYENCAHPPHPDWRGPVQFGRQFGEFAVAVDV